MGKNKDFLFTSESVSEGHPDKVCDRISDSILDLYIASDPEARGAASTIDNGTIYNLTDKQIIQKYLRIRLKKSYATVLKKLAMNQVFTGKIYPLNHMYTVNQLI